MQTNDTAVNAFGEPLTNAAVIALDNLIGKTTTLDSGLWSADRINDILGGYPLVWTVLFGRNDDGSTDVDDEDELTSEAESAQLAVYDDAYIPTLAQAIYTVLFGHIDSKFHRDEKLAEIADWLREGDIEGYPQPETLAREYDEWGVE